MANKTAKFWKYDGNNPTGHDCERYDPHNFGLNLIAHMAFWGDGGYDEAPLTYDDTKKILVTHHRGNDFGHEITVKAPKDVWERGAVALEAFEKAYLA